MASLKIVVITGGGSRHSSSALMGERLRGAVEEELRRLCQDSAGAAEALGEAEVKVTTHHLGQFAYELADFISDGFAPDTLASVLEDVRSADGLIVVTPVFKASYSGLFKLFWDVTEQGDIAGTPTALAVVGGTWRHSLVLDRDLRPLFGYLGAASVSRGVFATPAELTGSGAETERVDARIGRVGAELARAVAAGKMSL
ncbi:NAD(P)H-dependent oxidoreductase [Rothia sp. LK2588]|uniref:NAD(P)H-dependent oxidoreductase n=1 Tax=Rothia sp. LK2588 TaxID=3114369 RepID=UPI0034CD56EF